MNRKSRVWITSIAVVCALAVLLLLALPGAGAADSRSADKSKTGRVRLPSPLTKPAYVPGEVIVKFKDGVTGPVRNEVKRLAGAAATLDNIGEQGSDQTQVLKLDPGVRVEEAIARLQSSGSVAYAEPNYIARASYTPNDPSFGSEWGLNNTGQTINGVAGTPDADIDAPEAWNIEKGLSAPPTVAVIDSGIDASHPDLNAKVLTGYNWAGISQTSITDNWGNFGVDANSQMRAQSIKGTGQGLNHIGLLLGKNGSPSAGITVSVRSSLDGSDLASYSISPSEVSSGGDEVYKALSSTVSLSSGTTYYLVFRTSNSSATDNYDMFENSGSLNYNTYSDGQEYSFSGGSWSGWAGDDFYFRTNANANPRDDYGHGTHVSGIIGAVTNNATGIAGVCPGAKIMPLKAMNSAGSGSTSDINSAIYYAADHGAKIINMSLGSSSFSQSMQDAINYAHAKGVAVFASSGNTGNSTMNYPAGCSNVIGVGATTNQDQKASFSTYNSSVDVSAPGKDIYSTMPTYPAGMNNIPGGGYTQNYCFMSGTSMACPMAAGLGALVVSRSPSRTPQQVQQLLQNYANDLGSPGRDDYFGYGRINAFSTISHVAAWIISISPTSGYAGTTVTIKGDHFGSSRGTSYVKFGSKKCASSDYVSWGASQVKVKVPTGTAVGTQKVTLTTASGISNAKTFTVKAPAKPAASPTWYLAEGTTDYGFDCYITIENPNNSKVTAQVAYMTGSGPVTAPSVSLPPKSQATINPRDKLGDQDFSTKVVCKEGKTIAVDRTMSWTGPGAASPEAHSSIGVTSPGKTWYLPEGSSQWGFECWLLIQNPNTSAAKCTITYMIEGEGPKTVTKSVPASSRKTFNIADDIGQKDASIKVEGNIPVIPERAMYRNNRREGHDSIGTTSPANDYYLAEGATGYNVGYITYVLVQNPQGTPTDVTITYLTGSGQVAGPSMLANSRKTVRLNDQLPPNTDVSTTVHGSKPIIAERAMYWDNGTGEACHDSIGMASPHMTFYLPDGQTSEGRETWTLVQNPKGTDVTVDVTYMTPNGQGNVVKTETIPANWRKTFNMAEHSGISGRAAIMVRSKTAGKNIMVERAMYWNNRGAGTDTIGGYGD